MHLLQKERENKVWQKNPPLEVGTEIMMNKNGLKIMTEYLDIGI